MKEYQLTKIRNNFPDNSLKDVSEVCHSQLTKLSGVIGEGDSIGIGVGSRGINNIKIIVQEVVNFVKANGGDPFIIPAMGSHGGAMAEGQREILASYGITEENIGAPVRSSMEVVNVSVVGDSNPVYMDKYAFESDGVILVNKIKPHTDFHSTYESGLVKMSVIGLGKEEGATAIHHFGVFGLTDLIPKTAEIIFKTGKILGGVAVLENAYDKTMMIRAIIGNQILEEEPGLLDIARANRPELPVDLIDVLMVDQMGKNISGAGIDTNIIGRIKIYGQPEPERPKIRSIVVHDLTDESHGNAVGVGLADVITKRLHGKIDYEVTNKNVSTSSFLERGKIPIIADNDYEALQLALRNSGVIKDGEEKIIRIKDTLHLNELYVSDAVLNELKDNPRIEQTNEKMNMFNLQKTLNPF